MGRCRLEAGESRGPVAVYIRGLISSHAWRRVDGSVVVLMEQKEIQRERGGIRTFVGIFSPPSCKSCHVFSHPLSSLSFFFLWNDGSQERERESEWERVNQSRVRDLGKENKNDDNHRPTARPTLPIPEETAPVRANTDARRPESKRWRCGGCATRPTCSRR